MKSEAEYEAECMCMVVVVGSAGGAYSKLRGPTVCVKALGSERTGCL